MVKENLDLNKKTKKELEKARKQVKAGKIISHEEVKKRYRL